MSQLPIESVIVCVPCLGDPKRKFTQSYAKLLTATALSTVDQAKKTEAGWKIHEREIGKLSVKWVRSTYLHRARQTLARAAMDEGFEYVLWLDADMEFPKDTLARLYAHQKDIVGINYCRRDISDLGYVAVKDVRAGRACVTHPTDSTGLEQVEAIGLGVTLMKVDVFREMDPPWFDFSYLDDTVQPVGEDVHFCMRANDAGFDVWVDHDLSKECRHLGEFQYEIGHAWSAVPEEDKRPARELEAI